jgi:hypothetical protein
MAQRLGNWRFGHAVFTCDENQFDHTNRFKQGQESLILPNCGKIH